MTKKSLVIGSGIAGLASACLLAKKGRDVTVFEGGETYGGKIGEFRQEDFRFDKGPSLFTLPHVLDEVFITCGENPRYYFNYKQLPVVTKYIFPDKSVVNAYADLERFKEELVVTCGEDAAQLDKFFKNIQEVYDYVFPIFLENPLRNFLQTQTGSILDSIKMVFQMEAHKNLHKSNSDWFKNPKTIQIFDRFATYNGSNPFKAPATLNVIPHLEHKLGAYYVDGGMRTVASALYKLALKLGVTFKFNSKVSEILVKNKKALGVKVGETVYSADNIICNMDVNNAYQALMPKQKAPKIYLNQEKSTSALVFYWAVDTQSKDLEVHNILFSQDYRKEFAYLQEGKVSDDPTVYLYISSKADAADAPKGKENWFTMINVPHDTGQNWGRLVEELRETITNKINNVLGVDVKKAMIFEKVLTPLTIAKETASFAGALYGNSSNNMFSAFLRHPHKSKKIKGLSFVGGSVHPGGGIPLCLLSAKIACNDLD